MTSVGEDQPKIIPLASEPACGCSGCTCGAERESSDNTVGSANFKTKR